VRETFFHNLAILIAQDSFIANCLIENLADNEQHCRKPVSFCFARLNENEATSVLTGICTQLV